MTAAGTTVMWPQAQGHLEPPGGERGKKNPPLEPPGGVQPCSHLDLRLLVFGMVTSMSFV